jgi:hypothetical protein
VRGPADQRDVNVDIVQLRGVITAGRQVFHINIAARVQYPLPVPAAIS